jgi:hypothetical protein
MDLVVNTAGARACVLRASTARGAARAVRKDKVSCRVQEIVGNGESRRRVWTNTPAVGRAGAGHDILSRVVG